MIIYAAGNMTSVETEREFFELCSVKHRLLSFAGGQEATDFYLHHDNTADLFLDSGAFTAMNLGTPINLNEYCRWLKEREHRFACYAALDVIGDWRASAVNLAKMQDKGLNPVATFHLGSPLHELRRLCKIADYIALGGLVGADKLEMRPWLDKCFNIIYHEFWPKKVHAFGVLAQWALERYPFYSADGSTIIIAAGLGSISNFEKGKSFRETWQHNGSRTWDGSVIDYVSEDILPGSTSAYMGRRRKNAESFHKLERHVTGIWTLRGITWDNERQKEREGRGDYIS